MGGNVREAVVLTLEDKEPGIGSGALPSGKHSYLGVYSSAEATGRK